MRNGYDRFDFYMVKLEELLSKASGEKNPGLWLYSNDARTPLFMLEGLSKLYAELHNKNRFSKLKDDFKLLEDALGAIDYYDCFAREFADNPAIPPAVTEYMQAQAREKIQHLNDLLQQRNWVGQESSRIKKMRTKLQEADWMKDDKEVKGIADFYEQEIDDINEFAAKTSCKFSELENEVHELRRKLRWLSIYPRGLQGVIQLTESGVEDAALSKYLSPEIVNSPFNKMPDANNNRYFLVLEKNYFFALSWMIATLGKMKDNGLRIMAISEALEQTKKINKPEALALTFQALGTDHPTIQSILSEASAISKTYFDEKNLDKLLSGIATIS